MEIKAECYLGHTLKTVPWIDADGNLRIIVGACKECDNAPDYLSQALNEGDGVYRP